MGNAAERSPLATVGAPLQHSEKSLEMKVYPYVDFYILKSEITEKLSKNVRKTQKTITY